jgi:hypothetical protein
MTPPTATFEWPTPTTTDRPRLGSQRWAHPVERNREAPIHGVA